MELKLDLEAFGVQELSTKEMKKVNGGNGSTFETHGGVVYKVWWNDGRKYYMAVEHVG